MKDAWFAYTLIRHTQAFTEGNAMKAMLRMFAVVIAILSLAACQGTGGPVDGADITGNYYLVKVDGTEIPGNVMHDGTPMEIHSGTFFINDDGTCVSRTQFTPPGHDEQTREVRAKCVVEDSRLIMKWEGAGTTEGTVEGGIFIMDNHGMIFEYTRSP
jgi:hypothetical protein